MSKLLIMLRALAEMAVIAGGLAAIVTLLILLVA